MFAFFREKILKAGVCKCLIDAAVEPEVARELVYDRKITSFFNGIDKLTKGLPNQQRAIIGSLVMSSLFVDTGFKQANSVGGANNLSDSRNKSIYDMLLARDYLTQVLFITLKDASNNWRPLARAYVATMAYFNEDKNITTQELLDAEESLNPINLTLDAKKIEEVQYKKDRQDILSGRKVGS